MQYQLKQSLKRKQTHALCHKRVLNPVNGFAGYAAVVLAGGAGRRVLGADKGMLPYKGQSLASRSVKLLMQARLPVSVSCNRNLHKYSALVKHVLTDFHADFQGPLVALSDVLTQMAKSNPQLTHIVILPCDTPKLDERDLACLLSCSRQNPDDWVVACSKDGVHPVHGVFPVSRLPELVALVEAGQRRLMVAVRYLTARTVRLPASHLRNFNRLRQLTE